jgi:hypothetical protein
MSDEQVYVPHHWYGMEEQCGEGGLFNSPQARGSAVRKGLLHPGRLINGRRKNTGAELNSYIAKCPTGPKPLPKGFGGAQPNAGRRKQDQTSAST